MRTFRLIFVLTTLVSFSPSPSRAAAVLLISSGDPTNDANIESVLKSQGDTVVVGPTYANFTGGNLSGYNDVLLVPNGNSMTTGDMPASGQQALVNYVKSGGVLWFRSADGFGTESISIPNPGATAFFATNQSISTSGGAGNGYGVAGWNDGQGRVVSISTARDNISPANASFGTLVDNAINWARQGWIQLPIMMGPYPPIEPGPFTPAPEPATLVAWGAGILGMAAVAYIRRNRAKAGLLRPQGLVPASSADRTKKRQTRRQGLAPLVRLAHGPKIARLIRFRGMLL